MEVSKKVCNCARRKEGNDRQLRHAVPRSAECRRVSGLVQLSSTLKVRNGKGTDQDIPDTFRSRPLSIDFCTASPKGERANLSPLAGPPVGHPGGARHGPLRRDPAAADRGAAAGARGLIPDRTVDVSSRSAASGVRALRGAMLPGIPSHIFEERHE